MKWTLFLFSTLSLFSSSITGKDSAYLDICEKAASTPYYFQNFRSLPEYAHAVEITNGRPFADYILDKASDETWKKLPLFKKLESFGNPQTSYFAFLGNFSATTLRYIAIADEIEQRFHLPEAPYIVELGGGFGGQSYIFSHLHPFSRYTILDLPEAVGLIQKMTEALEIKNLICVTPDAHFPEGKIDLFISNYAFSECDRDTQIAYIQNVLAKAERGYLIYNQISGIYGIESLSPAEFIQHLESYGIRPKVALETIPTFDSNLLITWDKTSLGN